MHSILSTPASDVHVRLKTTATAINPLSPNINIQILQGGLHTFPLRIS